MYKFKTSEQNNDKATEFETKSLLYLLTKIKGHRGISLFIIDCFNDVTGVSEDYFDSWDIQSKNVASLTPRTVGKALYTLFANYVSDICAQIDLALHTKVCEEREKAGQTTSQYITQLLMEYYEMKENGGKSDMANSGNRTMAFQISEELFQRIKRHLERESKHLGRKYTQREFVLDLITEALDAAEAAEEAPEARQEEGEDLEAAAAGNPPVEAEFELEKPGYDAGW